MTSNERLSKLDMMPFWLTRTLNDLRRRWTPLLKPYGLTPIGWQVMAIIRRFDGMRIGQIADTILAEQAIISRTVNQLEKLDIVERRPDPEDSRANGVWLTQKGEDLYQTIVPIAHQFVDEWTQVLPPNQAALLADILEEWNAIIE